MNSSNLLWSEKRVFPFMHPPLSSHPHWILWIYERHLSMWTPGTSTTTSHAYKNEWDSVMGGWCEWNEICNCDVSLWNAIPYAAHIKNDIAHHVRERSTRHDARGRRRRRWRHHSTGGNQRIILFFLIVRFYFCVTFALVGLLLILTFSCRLHSWKNRISEENISPVIAAPFSLHMQRHTLTEGQLPPARFDARQCLVRLVSV